MRLSLSKSARNSYSPAEASLFEVLSSSKEPLALEKIALNLYGNVKMRAILNWRPIVRVTLTQLMKKMELNKEPLIIEKIKTAGEKELTYQIKKRKGK